MKKFIALYMGSPDQVGQPMPQLDEATVAKGMAAWGKWMQDHASIVVDQGGPLGRTKRTGKDGVSDMRNAVGGYTVFTAESHEAAARLFEDHPHFMIFPGDHVEIMEIMPIPGS